MALISLATAATTFAIAKLRILKQQSLNKLEPILRPVLKIYGRLNLFLGLLLILALVASLVRVVSQNKELEDHLRASKASHNQERLTFSLQLHRSHEERNQAIFEQSILIRK